MQNDKLTFSLDIPEKEFNALLCRALNTLEPQKQPKWAMPLCDIMNKHERIFNINLKLIRDCNEY